MFAIAFDLDTNDTEQNHPKSVTQAYEERYSGIFGYSHNAKALRFRVEAGQRHTCDNENLANLFDVIGALKLLPWFPNSVRDIRAFRVEQWSDFTPSMKR